MREHHLRQHARAGAGAAHGPQPLRARVVVARTPWENSEADTSRRSTEGSISPSSFSTCSSARRRASRVGAVEVREPLAARLRRASPRPARAASSKRRPRSASTRLRDHGDRRDPLRRRRRLAPRPSVSAPHAHQQRRQHGHDRQRGAHHASQGRFRPMPNRAAIVTGASSGIGLAIARMLGEEGYALTVAARRPEKLAAAAEELRGAGFDVEEVAGNMADEDTIKRVVAAHRDALRPPRRARQQRRRRRRRGGRRARDQADRHAARGQPARDRPLLPRVRCELLRAAGAEHRNALVVNTSSISGKSGQPWLSVYSATKAGVDRLHAGDEQGAQRRRDQERRAVPRLRRHADDRVRPRARPAEDMIRSRTSPRPSASC